MKVYINEDHLNNYNDFISKFKDRNIQILQFN